MLLMEESAACSTEGQIGNQVAPYPTNNLSKDSLKTQREDKVGDADLWLAQPKAVTP